MKNINYYQNIIARLNAEADYRQDFLEKYLPERITKNHFMDQIRCTGHSFLNDKLQAFYLESVFEIPAKGPYPPVLYALLLEIHTREDRILTLDLLEYMVEVIERQTNRLPEGKKDAKLQIIIPTVFYRTDNTFKAETLQDQMGDLPREIPLLVTDVPFICYHMEDLVLE